MNDLAAEVALLNDAVREAGALALRFFRRDPAAWQKAGGTPVSEVDIAVDRHLRQMLCDARPGYGWLSEETEDDTTRLDRRRVWVVDPIDGTRAFLDGTPHFCHAVALVEDGFPIVAALFNPATDEFYEAAIDRGARLNGAPIHVSDRRELAGCRMVAYAPMFKHPAWPEPWPDMEILQRDSVAYRLALVAGGGADAAMGLNTKNDWDLAAADLIVREAGGRVTLRDGTRLRFNTATPQQPSFLAAGPRLHATLLARTSRLRPRPRAAAASS